MTQPQDDSIQLDPVKVGRRAVDYLARQLAEMAYANAQLEEAVQALAARQADSSSRNGQTAPSA